MQDVLAKEGVQCRQPLADRGHARFLGWAKPRPGAHEAQMVAFEQAHLVFRQPELAAPRIEVRDPREQAWVERDACLMLGELGRVIAGDRFERRVGVARIEIGKDPAHPIEQSPAALQRLDRVGKGGRRRARRQSPRSRRSARPCRGQTPAGSARDGCDRTAACQTACPILRKTGSRSLGFLIESRRSLQQHIVTAS